MINTKINENFSSFPIVTKRRDHVSLGYDFYYQNKYDYDNCYNHFFDSQKRKHLTFYRKHYPMEKITIFEGKIISEFKSHFLDVKFITNKTEEIKLSELKKYLIRLCFK